MSMMSQQSAPGKACCTSQERTWFTHMLTSNRFKDALRVVQPDTPGLYSWWPMTTGGRHRNLGWRLDYFMISDALTVKACRLLTRQDGSDHCPCELVLTNVPPIRKNPTILPLSSRAIVCVYKHVMDLNYRKDQRL